jgi:hypothetical protein
MAKACAGAGIAMLMGGLGACSTQPAKADPSAGSAPSLSPADPVIASAVIRPDQVGPGWSYLSAGKANATRVPDCIAGALMSGQVSLRQGSVVLVEGVAVFDSTQHASAYLRAQARGVLCPGDAPRGAPATRVVIQAVSAEAYAGRRASSIPGRPASSFVMLCRGRTVVDVVSSIPLAVLEQVASTAAHQLPAQVS